MRSVASSPKVASGGTTAAHTTTVRYEIGADQGGAAGRDAGDGQIERRLRAGSVSLVRSSQRYGRQLLGVFADVGQRWVGWSGEALAFMAIILIAPVFDRRLVRVWRTEGMRGAGTAVALAVAIYVRLLFDRRVPGVGRVLLACAVVYGVAPNDLVPDQVVPWGLLDDLLALCVCSRCFVRLSTDKALAEHAQRARSARARALLLRAISKGGSGSGGR